MPPSIAGLGVVEYIYQNTIVYMGLLKPKYHLWIIILVVVATRLPQLLNPIIALDGDECISAIMVKHMIEGRELPLYFYGQSYGFTFIESVFCIPLSLIAGVTTFSIKASMLLMWLLGVVFFYKALSAANKGNAIIPFIITMLLATTPAWAVWSMKARGGYMTAFTLTSVVMYLLLDERLRKKNIVWLIAGIFAALIYEAQPLWILGLAPVIVYCLLREFKFAKAILFLLPAIGILVALHSYKSGLYQNYPVRLTDIEAIMDNTSRIPQLLYDHLCGKYYLAIIYPDNLFTAVFAYAFIAIMLLLVLSALYRLLFMRDKDVLFLLAAGSILLIVFCTNLALYSEPRFLLPVTGFTLFALQLWLNHISKIKPVIIISGMVLILIGTVGTITFHDFSSGRMKRTDILTMIDYLKKQDVQHVFVTYAVLDFQLIFYSDEKIMARNRWYPGRYPPYVNEVDNAFFNGKKVAVVGYPGEYEGMNLVNVHATKGYFIAVNPDENEVKRMVYGQ